MRSCLLLDQHGVVNVFPTDEVSELGTTRDEQCVELNVLGLRVEEVNRLSS